MLPKQLLKQARERIAPYPVEGFVYGQGPIKTALMLVGEAPGETEIATGIPFSGRSGKQLMRFIERLDMSRGDVYITSAVRSRPFKWIEKKMKDGSVVKKKANRPPTQKEVIAHAPLLDYELGHVDARVVVTLGNIGLNRLIGPGKTISAVHGQMFVQPVRRLIDDKRRIFGWTEKKYRVFPLFHPASIFYNRSLLPLIETDLEKLKKWLEK
ncbi:uracil-DNA glycosylase [Terrilactibacillus sp. S3-3]|nr:uracil-DNA glycosylase [Terrilactibacillus sp. S3-3]